jgi:hypothetical protein
VVGLQMFARASCNYRLPSYRAQRVPLCQSRTPNTTRASHWQTVSLRHETMLQNPRDANRKLFPLCVRLERNNAVQGVSKETARNARGLSRWEESEEGKDSTYCEQFYYYYLTVLQMGGYPVAVVLQ